MRTEEYQKKLDIVVFSVESTSRNDMRVLKVMTDHETTNTYREKLPYWHKHGEDNKTCTAVRVRCNMRH